MVHSTRKDRKMANRNSKMRTGGEAAIIMILLLGAMLSSFILAWYTPNPLQIPLQKAIKSLILWQDNPSSINGYIIVTDTTGTVSSISPSTNQCYLGCIIYSSAGGNSGRVDLQALVNITSGVSWNSNTVMAISVDGSQVSSSSLITQGTAPITNALIQEQILSGYQINGYLSSTTSSSVHTLSVSLSGAITVVFFDGTTRTQSFSQTSFITLQVVVNVGSSGYIVSV